MRKLLVCALAAAGMVACVNEDVVQLPKSDVISFADAFINNSTRAEVAADPSLTKETLKAFDVWAYMTSVDGTVLVDEDVELNGTKWDYANLQYWTPNKDYFFAALAPMNSNYWDLDATEAVFGEGAGLVTFENNDGSEDLIYATASATTPDMDVLQEEGMDAVKFQFQHLLSKVKFTFKNGFLTENATIKIENVTMSAPKSGEINLGQGFDWVLDDEDFTLEFGNVGELSKAQGQPNSAQSDDERLTIPADETYTYNIEFDVTLYYGTEEAYSVHKKSVVTGVALEMGKAYNFVAEINPDNLNLLPIVFEVEGVDSWVPEGGQDVDTGKTVAVASADELKAAIADPEVYAVILTEDINLNSSTITRAEGDDAVVVEKQYFTIDGAGNTLTYSGSNRVIDFVKGDVVKAATIKNLTINITSSYCERGINFNNANGSLKIENVTFEGTAPTYAVNFPGSSNGATVTIENSYLAGNIALNVWGKNMDINVVDTELVSVDHNELEGYAAVKLNNDGSTIAEGTVINIVGGKINALDEKGEPSKATYNATDTGVINVSETTEVVGFAWDQVAIVDYGTSQFYGMSSLQDAIDKVAKDNNGKIRVTKNIELTKGVTIPAGANVEIDLNGKTISAVDTTEKNYELIKNAGTLVVKNGTLKVEATINSGWNRYSAVIANTVGGNLTVVNANIEHLGGTDMAYGIDNLTNGKGTYAVTTIDNTAVKSTYRAVRQFLNGVEATNELYVKAGSVLDGANKSIFFHDPSKNANTGKLVVEDGAELKGDVYLFVTAGSTEWPVEVSIAASALAGESTVLSGNVPEGYAVELVDGTWTVVK